MKLKEIKPNTVVHCNTEEEAKELIKWAYECGFCWQYEDEHLQTFWNHVSNADKIYKFYNNSIYISQLCNNRKSEIIEFSDLIIQDEEELTAVEVIKLKNEMCNNCYNSFECIFKQKYSEKISISCNEWVREYPEEVIESLKQYKKNHSSNTPKKPEIEWVYYCYEFSGKSFEDNYTTNENEAIEWCEQETIDFASYGFRFSYEKLCRVKEN